MTLREQHIDRLSPTLNTLAQVSDKSSRFIPAHVRDPNAADIGAEIPWDAKFP